MTETAEWMTLSQAFAFLGNSLLKPLSQTSDAGMDPAFWGAFPDFGDEAVAAACDSAADAAEGLARRGEEEGRDPVELASVEFTRLFVGPPKPAAAPWESFYLSDGDVSVGFGAATFAMRELLREAGLEVSNENNQYEDHIGLELLFLSELCRRRGEGSPSLSEDEVCGNAAILAYVSARPLGWIGDLRRAVQEAAAGGYIDGVLAVAEALLRHLAASLK